MKTLLISAAFAAALLAPAAASAQAVPAAVVAVVDLDRVAAECNACKTARASLQSQVTAFQNRQKALATPLETERKSIQAAVDALNGKEPDAALKTRAQSLGDEAAPGGAGSCPPATADPGQQPVRPEADPGQARPDLPAGDAAPRRELPGRIGATLATSSNVDVTNDVLAALNSALPTIATTAPAAPAPKQPQGR